MAQTITQAIHSGNAVVERFLEGASHIYFRRKAMQMFAYLKSHIFDYIVKGRKMRCEEISVLFKAAS